MLGPKLFVEGTFEERCGGILLDSLDNCCRDSAFSDERFGLPSQALEDLCAHVGRARILSARCLLSEPRGLSGRWLPPCQFFIILSTYLAHRI